MAFSEKQKAVVTKALYYLSDRLTPESIAILARVEPKNYIVASEMIGYVMAIAYGRGDMIGDIWHPVERHAEQERLAVEFTKLLQTYAL